MHADGIQSGAGVIGGIRPGESAGLLMTKNGDNWDEKGLRDYPRDSGDSLRGRHRGLILEMGGAMTGDNQQACTNRPFVPDLSGIYPSLFPKTQVLNE